MHYYEKLLLIGDGVFAILSGRYEEKKMRAMAIFYVTELEAK